MKQICLLFWILIFCINLPAQAIFLPDSVKKRVKAHQIEGKIKIDGKLDEPEWQLSTPVKDFIQTDPFQGESAHKQTIVRLLYNKLYLYVSAICYDTVGKNKYRTLNFKRDFFTGSGDDFSIAIDGYNDERNAMSFSTNPYGVQSDLLSFDDNYYDSDWDGLWIVRTQRTDTAWIAEMAIPWKTLRYKNKQDSTQTWGIGFSRVARAENEISTFPAVPRAYGPLRMVYAAKLTDFKTPPASTNVRVQPYLLYANNQSKRGSNIVLSDNTIKPGGDVKWAINTNTLLDVTFNTDFAQTDVDRFVNNTTRFSVFFPEKRQFFLENAGLFATGIEPLPANGLAEYSTVIQPFFSRTIGLDETGRPLSIDAGARLVSRSDRRNIGGLLVRQHAKDSTNGTYLMVGRYSQNFGKQHRVGALVSYKTDEQELGTKNFTGTVDGFFRFGQGLSLSSMASVTKDFKGETGYAGSAQVVYNSNTLAAWWNQSFVTQQYKPEMGFVARENVIVTEPGFYYQIRGKKWLPKFLRAIYPGVSYITYHNTATLKLTDRYFNIIPVWFRFQNAALIFWNIVDTKQNLDEDLHLLGTTISKGTYNYTRQKLGFRTDQSKKISGTITAQWGKFYDGTYNALTTSLSIAPLPYFFISPIVEIGRLNRVGAEKTSKNINLYAIEARAALNPRVQLSALIQKYSAANATNWNVRFAWEFKPLSYFYIVFNKNAFTENVRIDNQQFITKFSYLKQF